MILGSEKDFIKFYHANLLDVLEEQKIDYRLLTSITKKIKIICDDINKNQKTLLISKRKLVFFNQRRGMIFVTTYLNLGMILELITKLNY